jgi:hypothetical protein
MCEIVFAQQSVAFLFDIRSISEKYLRISTPKLTFCSLFYHTQPLSGKMVEDFTEASSDQAMATIDWQNCASRKLVLHEKDGRVPDVCGATNAARRQTLRHLLKHGCFIRAQS